MTKQDSVYEKVCSAKNNCSDEITCNRVKRTAKLIDKEGKGTDIVDKLLSDKVSSDFLFDILNVASEVFDISTATLEEELNPSSNMFDRQMDYVLEYYYWYGYALDTQPKVVCTKEEKHDWYILRKLDSYISHRLYQGVAYSDMKELYGKDKLIQLLKSDMDSLKNNNTNENVSDYLIIFGEEYGARPKNVSTEMEHLYEQFIRDPSNGDIISKKLYRIYQKILRECQSKESVDKP